MYVLFPFLFPTFCIFPPKKCERTYGINQMEKNCQTKYSQHIKNAQEYMHKKKGNTSRRSKIEGQNRCSLVSITRKRRFHFLRKNKQWGLVLFQLFHLILLHLNYI